MVKDFQDAQDSKGTLIINSVDKMLNFKDQITEIAEEKSLN